MLTDDDHPMPSVNENGHAEAQETDALLSSPDATRQKRRRFRLTGLGLSLGVLLIIAAAIVAGTLYRYFVAGGRHKTGINWKDLRPPQPGLRNPSYFVRGRHGAVATELGTCSNVGVDVLRENGTATDAAIAAALCIGVVNMFSSGLGGGGFLVSRPGCPSGRGCRGTISVDFRETAPTGASPNMFDHRPLASVFGALANGVPGEMRGFEAAYQAHGGGVSWQRLFEPNIRLAELHHVEAQLARKLKLLEDFIAVEPEWADLLKRSDGQILQEGDPIRRPALARTLRTLSEHGADAFYRGPIAHSLVETVKNQGGSMTLDDLASYRALVKPALTGTYRNRTIYTAHPPSSGALLLSLLNTLEPLEGFIEEGRTPLNMHRFVEAQKFAFAHRTEFGDPAFVNNSHKWIEVIDKKFGRKTLEKIRDDETHPYMWYKPHFDIKEDHGTTHISVMDSHGGACSLTTTINTYFGNHVLDPNTGIMLNNEMNDFATPNTPDAFGLRPSPYNYPEGPRHPGEMGKRPLSSISPTIVEADDGTLLVFGGSGGSRIFGAVAQCLLLLDWGYDLQHAVEEPRVHNQLLPEWVSIESGMPTDLIDGLRARRHNISMFDVNLGMAEVQAVMRRDMWIYGASDSRKNGRAAAL